jgi:hypothetical protein
VTTDELRRAREIAHQATCRLLASLMAEVERLRSDIEYLRNDWTPFSPRQCPACVYGDAGLERRCKVHESEYEISGRLAEARAEVERLRADREALRARVAELERAILPHNCSDYTHDEGPCVFCEGTIRPTQPQLPAVAAGED